MPSWRNMPSIPNVRASSGTIGTMYLPMALSRNMVDKIRTNAMVVDISRSPVLTNIFSKVDNGGITNSLPLRRRAGTEPPMAARRSAMYSISGESGAGLYSDKCSTWLSVNGKLKRSRKALSELKSMLFC